MKETNRVVHYTYWGSEATLIISWMQKQINLVPLWQRSNKRTKRTNKRERERDMETSGGGKMDQKRLKGAQQLRWKTGRKKKDLK